MNLPDCRLNNFTLYVHIAPNGKQYFGITSKVVTRRWSDGEGYKNNNHFYNAIKKYGWANFQHEGGKRRMAEYELTRIGGSGK